VLTGMSLFGVEMSPLLWGLLVVSVVAVIGLRMAREEGSAPNRLESMAWGLTLAMVSLVAYLSYSASDVAGVAQWIVSGQGRIWIGIAFVTWAGYIWQQTSGEVDNRRDMVDTLRERVTRPMLAVGGIISTVLITALVGLSTLAAVSGDILGFVFGAFAAEPGFGAAVVTTIGGWISFGGSVPLIDSFIPAWARSVSPAGWVGFCGLVIIVGLSFRSQNFRQALIGRGN